ncbi:TolC family protein [Helicobacter sp. MIT 05-5293]|uniref:TolC family protein n=1 Tax=Helicobacter sp. MIT 05-5293 TaxID=1548149 RepID=UPI000AF1E961|nr:TolC family protein [Helicobacter sp. MIT 05-5293]TLD82181.1 TolC family protein [Helicobacter sp. MIT 05-5293]
MIPRVFKGWSLCLVSVLCGVGCTTKIPNTQEIASLNHIPESFRNAQSSVLQEKASQTDIEAFSQFTNLIDDKMLYSLVEIALEKNTNVLAMASRIKQAQAQAKISTANMFPTINGGINTSYIDRRTLSESTRVQPGANSVNATASLSWELDLFGKLNALRQSSKKDYAQAQSNLQYAQITLIAEVGTLYFTLRENAYNLKAAQSMLQNHEEILRINSSKHTLGLIDVSTYRGLVANTTNQRNNVETLSYTYEQNKNALLTLLNISANELDSKVDFLDSQYDLPSVKEFYVNTLPSEVLLSRPDIQSTIYALHSQLYKETNAKAARFPTISFNGSIGEILYSSNGAGSLVFQIANAITAPLLNRTSLRQNHLIQKELSKEAYYTLQNTINTALGEIENALFDIDSKKRQTENNASVLDVGLKAYESDKRKNRDGLLDKNDFLTNENTFVNLQTQFFTSKTNEILAVITLFKAFGGNLYISNTEVSQVNPLKEENDNKSSQDNGEKQ